MKTFKATLLALFLVFVLALPAMAEQQQGQQQQQPPADQMSHGQACTMIGGCGNDMVAAAQQMMVQCDNMIATAKKLKDKGIQIKTHGQITLDQQMIAEGEKLIQQAEQMEEQARKMSEACRLLVEQGKKLQQEGAQMTGPGHPEPDQPPRGDFRP